jgi:hypothetical protein
VYCFYKKGVMTMEKYLGDALGWVNDASGIIQEVLSPLAGFLLTASALVIVVSCLLSAFEQLKNLHQDREVLSAVVLGADVVMAMALMSLAGSNSPLNALYLVASVAVAMGVRLSVAKLGK